MNPDVVVHTSVWASLPTPHSENPCALQVRLPHDLIPCDQRYLEMREIPVSGEQGMASGQRRKAPNTYGSRGRF
jgi:hypothetical protein